MFDINNIRKDFPILKNVVNGNPLVYLDNAAITQTPRQVVDKMIEFEFNYRANVNRGNHTMVDRATEIYDNCRINIAEYFGVSNKEIVFIKNTTEGVNIVARAWGYKNITKDDIILVSSIEHNSNLVPWIELAEEKNAKVVVIPVDENGVLDIKKIDVDFAKVKLLTFAHISGAIGNINDAYTLTKYVKRKVLEAGGNMPRVLVDGTAAVSYLDINLKKLGCDFYVFSGSKMFGPMGTGILYITKDSFDEITNYNFGGGMVKEINSNNVTYKELPTRLEPGTPNLTGIVGLSAAVDYIKTFDKTEIFNYMQEINIKVLQMFSLEPDTVVYGLKTIQNRVPIFAFNVKGIPAHDLSTILDMDGIEIRSGQQCVMSWHQNQGIKTTARASFSIYNKLDEVDKLFEGIKKAKKTFKI